MQLLSRMSLSGDIKSSEWVCSCSHDVARHSCSFWNLKCKLLWGCSPTCLYIVSQCFCLYCCYVQIHVVLTSTKVFIREKLVASCAIMDEDALLTCCTYTKPSQHLCFLFLIEYSRKGLILQIITSLINILLGAVFTERA